MPKALASLSLDLDNKWSYMKTHGDEGWEAFPSYLDTVVPRVLDFLKRRDLTITFFVVGQDAVLPENGAALKSLADAGHEIGNHSFHHEPWLHLYKPEQIEVELARAEEAILSATGKRPTGFRGPGFSFSPQLLKTLAARGYEYDASTFPTFLGPLARLYYFFTSDLTPEEKADRKQLFGKLSEGFRPLRPYVWPDVEPPLLEIPVTTMPLFKVPIHVSYLLYLGQFSQLLAMTYFRMALRLCQLMRVEPSLLLHPLDFMGGDDDADLAFFPAMGQTAEKKIDLVGKAVDLMASRYDVVPMHKHAAKFIGELPAGSSRESTSKVQQREAASV
ncbi:polysaccharide deacetylase family protein [Adhaeretor mobilis]|uniref:Peptidoglycan-N-acetylmuramic acid deacetylase PdaA n=1 Tax=Adhaeretor mobilis TaxID=1930276 RepID=A0A517MW38_9BACT|nr:polysaccharide deacetylase family protein [Adhaeretor mobilis]QDS99007.1 Peptidoglycan-N-acetylmuramic acid deacetylase PdaA precursor [Adhaeretor mobilis]